MTTHRATLSRGPLESPSVTSRDRLVTTLFFAALVHGIIILGITFRPEKPKGSATLEVTMVQTRNVVAPKLADYIAQANQQGEGNTKELVRPESPLSMPAAVNNAGQPDAPDLADNPGRSTSTGDNHGVNRSDSSEHAAAVTTTALTGTTANAKNAAAPLSVEPRIMVARLLTPGDDALMPNDDGLELPQATDAKPRESFVSVNARESRYAPYLDAWRRKVEHIGNLNFPAAIRSHRLTGSLALEVALNSDGSIRELFLTKPSNQPLLDDSALHIVKMAAPFAAFPENLRRDTAVLRFVYVWRFNGGRLDARGGGIHLPADDSK
ncbi:MAG TPA: TonB family protein [Gammaproteobacteria bacterium]|jgi:protein TonB|nr:TonB family protein [Gammaproteobacteria bacterium]